MESTLEKSVRLDGIKILLVDDAPDNRLLVGRILTLAGAEVDYAVNGRDGLNKGLGARFDAIVMDIQMPEMDGYEATERLRKAGFRRPILALTAHALKEERERSFNAGCDDHLTKPVNRRLLIERLSHFVREIHGHAV